MCLRMFCNDTNMEINPIELCCSTHIFFISYGGSCVKMLLIYGEWTIKNYLNVFLNAYQISKWSNYSQTESRGSSFSMKYHMLFISKSNTFYRKMI